MPPKLRKRTKYVRTFRERKTLFNFMLNRFQYSQIPSSAKNYIFHLCRVYYSVDILM